MWSSQHAKETPQAVAGQQFFLILFFLRHHLSGRPGQSDRSLPPYPLLSYSSTRPMGLCPERHRRFHFLSRPRSASWTCLVFSKTTTTARVVNQDSSRSCALHIISGVAVVDSSHNVYYELGAYTPAASSASPCGVSSNLSSLNAGSFHWFLPTCLLVVLQILLACTFVTSRSLCTQGPVTWEARHGLSRAHSGSVSKWLDCAWGDTTSARSVWHAPPCTIPSFVLVASVCSIGEVCSLTSCFSGFYSRLKCC